MLDELLALQGRCEAEHRRTRLKWILVLLAGVPLTFAIRVLQPTGILALINLPIVIWFAFGSVLSVVLGIALVIRSIQRQRFIHVLRTQAPQVTGLVSELVINHLLGGDGTYYRISTMDGASGTAWFLGADLEPAKTLLKQICPNLRETPR